MLSLLRATKHIPANSRKQLLPAVSQQPILKSIYSSNFHNTPARESTVIVGALGVAVAAVGAGRLVNAYQAYAAQPKSERKPWFNSARNFYDGPFEETMTRREAALILGVRESASADRIRTAHRKLLILNHPDTGGSTFLSTKINEAKDLLLSGKE